VNNINTSYNKFLLTFNDENLNNDFHYSSINRVKKLTQVAIILGIIMFSVTATIQLLSGQEESVITSLIFVPITSLIFFSFSFTKYYEKFYHFLIYAVYVVGSMSIIFDFISAPQFLLFIYIRLLFFSFIAYSTVKLLFITNITLFFSLIVLPLFTLKNESEVLFKSGLAFIPFFLITILAFYIKKRIEINNYIKTLELEQKNEIINKEKNLVEYQQVELKIAHSKIKSSIEYAKRIQNSLLNTKGILETNFKNTSVLFKPKEVVSGDFYYFNKQSCNISIAVADCTGHGVPGALVATLCTQELNQLINSNIYNPAQVIDKLSYTVNQLLNNDKELGSDGLDIGLVNINSETKMISYAGAKGIIYIFKNNKLIQLKTDRISIGQKIDNLDFNYSLKQIEYTKGDTLFLLTDGIIDQLSITNQKRIGSKKVKFFLEKIANLNTLDKNKKIEEFINTHVFSNQTDDITLISLTL